MSSVPINIFLIGLMGAGKSSVGKVLAKRLGKVFIDSDHEIEKRCGVKIPTIFEMEGEEGFRKRESAVIKELCQMQDIVLATGGGSVLLPENRQILQSHGHVVYLRANPHELWLRTRHDRGRPLLNTQDPEQKLKELFDLRDPIYLSIAHQIIETGKPNVNQLTNKLVMQLELTP
ncbi:MAG: shikimate kinase [Burkholderiales bacterium]|nr:shikimate kinase [Burkholderiales bacterium]